MTDKQQPEALATAAARLEVESLKAQLAERASHGQAPAPAATGDDREGNDADH